MIHYKYINSLKIEIKNSSKDKIQKKANKQKMKNANLIRIIKRR